MIPIGFVINTIPSRSSHTHNGWCLKKNIYIRGNSAWKQCFPPKQNWSGFPLLRCSTQPSIVDTESSSPSETTVSGKETQGTRRLAIRVRQILVETEELGKYCLEEIRKGYSMEDLARSISMDKLSKTQGGDLGWIFADSSVKKFSSTEKETSSATVQPDLLQVFFQTPPRTARMHKTHNGWLIFRVEDVQYKLQLTVERRKSSFSSASAMRTASDFASSYWIETLGCQMNKADTERMAGELEAVGLRLETDPNKADVFLINTCSIRDHAEQKLYSHLGYFVKRKRSNPKLTIVVAGCVAQQEGYELLRRIPEIDLVIGPQYANRLGDLLVSVWNGYQLVATEPTHIVEDLSQPRRDSSVTAWVNVIYGCNENCTYCVVPHVRGREQSRSKEAIKEEIRQLASKGYKEVVLLGQNIDAYGRDWRPRETFTNLLYYIHDVEGIERIRFTTSHPRYFTERLIRACAELDKVCESFHIPFQSGNNQVLKEMARGYTVERYLQIVDNIRRYIPDASISADAIVGFPGETEEQFQDTLNLMEKVKFDQVHTAAYSPRPNTPAAKRLDQVTEAEKMDRLRRINERNEADAYFRSQRYIGRVEQVLIEKSNERCTSQVVGRTRTNRLVYLDGNIEDLKGKLVSVQITQARAFSLSGLLKPWIIFNMPVASTLAATDAILSKIAKSMMRVDGKLIYSRKETRKIVDDCLELLKHEKSIEDPLKYVHEAFLKITPSLGTKPYKVKKKFVPVTASLTETQQWTKAAEFIWEAARDRLETNVTERLAAEIQDLHEGEGLAKTLYDEWMQEAEESQKNLYLRCRATKKYAVF
eukprot:jgi/Galph1/33/GphlegSOOS_G4805.1